MIIHRNREFVRAAAAVLVLCVTLAACKKSEQAEARSAPAEKPAKAAPTPAPSEVAKSPRPTRRASSPSPSTKPDGEKQPETEAKSPPEVVKDPSAIVMEDGFPQPKVGDKIYGWHNLPEDACGEYWVKSADGKVAKVAVCRDQH